MWLYSQSIQLKSICRSPKTREPSEQKTNEKKKEIHFPRVYYAVTLYSTLSAKRFAFSFSFHHPVCVRCFHWLCSVSMNQCEWHKGVAEWRWTLDICCCGIWVQVQRQQLYQYMFLQLGPWQHHFKEAFFLEVCWSQVGLDIFKGFLYQKYCCASVHQLFLCFSKCRVGRALKQEVNRC